MSEPPVRQPRGLLIVVSAPSGAGKTSVCREILRMFPKIRFSVSSTTRPPRPGEVDGKDYHFLSEEEFRKRISRGDFVEWVENYGQLYGTSRETLESFLGQGYDLLLDIEPRGAKKIRLAYPQGIFVFILPPSLPALRERLSKRGERGPALERRLESSLGEIREALWYDYAVFNDRLEEAVDRFRAIYLAEASRLERVADRVNAFFINEAHK